MPYEDFTTYTEVDPNGHLSKTPTRASFTSLTCDEKAYIYKDKTAGYFDGDFTHHLDCKLTASSSNPYTFVWALANAVNEAKYFIAGLHPMLGVDFYASSCIYAYEVHAGGVEYEFIDTVINTQYWLVIRRDESVGAFGTLYLEVYDDAARTSLVGSVSLTLHTKEDFRYIYAVQGYYHGDSGRVHSGYMQNLDLQGVQTITPSSIASAEAFGTPTIFNLLQFLLPDAIASAEAFGTPKLQLYILPTGIASLEAFGVPKFQLYLLPSSIVSAEAFGKPWLINSSLSVAADRELVRERLETAVRLLTPLRLIP